jgi:hypothetical protein
MDRLAEAIFVAGGPVTNDSCPEFISESELAIINKWFFVWKKCFVQIFRRYSFNGDVEIALTPSPDFSCRVFPLEESKFLILIPLGVAARVKVLARLLLKYWDKGEEGILVLRSPRDNISVPDNQVPRLLSPLFLDKPNSESFWKDIDELDRAIITDSKFDPDVQELVSLSLLFLISHEITHILHGHFDLLERSENDDLGLSKVEIERGIEIDADSGAAAISMLVIQMTIIASGSIKQKDDEKLAFFRLSYVITMLFGIFDAQKKYLYGYDEQKYSHPMVRCEIFAEGVLAALSEDSEDSRDQILQSITDGRTRCVFAFNYLILDVMQGMFGGFPEGADWAPLQSLVYGRSDIMALWKKLLEANEILQKTRTLLPIFKIALN